MNKSTRWEYIGGHQWSLFEESEDGYDDTICSIEIGNVIEVIYMSRPLTKIELKEILNTINKI